MSLTPEMNKHLLEQALSAFVLMRKSWPGHDERIRIYSHVLGLIAKNSPADSHRVAQHLCEAIDQSQDMTERRWPTLIALAIATETELTEAGRFENKNGTPYEGKPEEVAHTLYEKVIGETDTFRQASTIMLIVLGMELWDNPIEQAGSALEGMARESIEWS